EWRKVREIENTEEKHKFIVNLYRSKLREFAKYVWYFEMKDRQNRTLYYLFFATNHIKGLKHMKRAMMKVDERGTYRFSDFRDVNQSYLINFSDETYWIEEVAEAIYKNFKGKTASVKEIEEFVLVETPYLLKKESLKILERQGKIIDVEGRKKAFTYPERCKIKFSDSK
ncbi:MAG: hypothetical protein H5T46_05565, partial [Archaeoglobi archaeon]|nr:hypothetical protein [Candidatus Mnemosynella sp.]